MDTSGRGEFAAIARAAASLPGPPAGELWIGDDTAVLHSSPGPLLFAIDAVVAGVHADLDLVGLDDLGWKAMAVNVSDVAAMGGDPRAAVVSVSGPPDTDLDLLYQGIAAAADYWTCPVVGGDLTTGAALVVTVAIVGSSGSEERPVVPRSGACRGDSVFLTGPLGASAAGLRCLRNGERSGVLVDAYRRPLARVEEGRAARHAGATAMIDVSDGFAADVTHILDASGVGARLHELPVATGATVAEAATGGEDYELVFTAQDPERVRTEFAAAGLRPPVEVGLCTAEAGVVTLDDAPLPPGSWEHPWT